MRRRGRSVSLIDTTAYRSCLAGGTAIRSAAGDEAHADPKRADACVLVPGAAGGTAAHPSDKARCRRDIRSAHPEVARVMPTSFADDEALFASIMAGVAGLALAGPSRWLGDAIEYQSGSESAPEQFVKGPLEVPVDAGWPMMPVACIWRNGRYHGEASPPVSVSTGRTSSRLSRSGIASTPVATTPKRPRDDPGAEFLRGVGTWGRRCPRSRSRDGRQLAGWQSRPSLSDTA
jgi:hypothetical protein